LPKKTDNESYRLFLYLKFRPARDLRILLAIIRISLLRRCFKQIA